MFQEIIGNKEKASLLTLTPDLYVYPSHTASSLLCLPLYLHQQPQKKVSPHGTPSKHNYSPSGRLLLKEITYIPALMSNYNWPFLPPPTSFFNIQIGCFVWLNWRLIAHTIWRCLFKKTVALFFFHSVPVIKVRD